MSKIIIVLIGFLVFAGYGSAFLLQDGRCETIKEMTGFSLSDFTSTWYEIGKLPNSPVPDCASIEFTYDAASEAITVSNPSVVNNFPQPATGTATLEDGTSRFTLNLSSSNYPIGFWVLNTDYTNYAIAYDCINFGDNARIISVWQLSRAVGSFENSEVLALANNDLQQLGITVNDLVPVDHSADACTQLPVIGDGQPVILPGQCNNGAIPAVQNFRVNDFTGTWHEISSYYSANALGTCARAEYELVGNTVNVVNSQVLNGRLETITGTATLSGSGGDGRLNVILDVEGTPLTQELLILGTDYEGYAVSYTCVNLPNNQRQVNSWILSRTKEISAASQLEIDRVISSLLDLNKEYYRTTDQTDDGCFYYPVLQPGVPVVFPGQCDPNIPVQADFDPSRYVDLWHDVQSYPSTFQQGNCNNAFYTLTEQGTVDVFNTQVVNQRLDTMTGEATIPDPNQPAKLLVSFPVAGTDQRTSTNYWVLATDYESYSLVYTCENLENDKRAVFSWKLSRTKTLSASANAAMDAVIANIPVLHSQYYSNRDQTETGCFYFPDPAPGKPVIFPGQCDDSVAVVPNFHRPSFAGTWHEVEAYPKEYQTGSCVNHEFTHPSSGPSFLLQSNQVVNQIATSASGYVFSLDGAKLAILMEGQMSNEIPYWILATDYTSYALAYSCKNINNDYRSIHSWKLSRTQTLSSDALTAINEAMEAVPVLDNAYFEAVDQSEEGCFVYPVIPDGDPIILEGQCETVTPVSNFQPSDFAGTWYEISRYPSARQTGSCAASQFTSTGQNTIALTQTVVYNESLVVVTGTATVPAGNSGVLSVTFTDGDGLSFQSTIYVMDVEYSDFAVLYSCENLAGTTNRQVFSWKLSRSQSGLSAAANTRIAQLFANNRDLFEGYFQATGQTNEDCFHYPVFEETPDAIILPGSCPEVTGRVVFGYFGNWYSVENYPTLESQNGTCSRIEVGIVDSIITVRRTIVVNGELKTIFGSGRFIGGASGVAFEVTFLWDNGVLTTQKYYVLETDNLTYALVYSCRNLPDGSHQVYSWKLSRTPTLTDEANTAINNVIASTQGLLQDYYQPSGQTEADCFYVPHLVPGQSVLFRGTCEQITGIQFDVNQYLGLWHEIERYPVDDSPGQCSRANFVYSGLGMQVVEASVDGGALNETISVASLGSDGSITIMTNRATKTWHVLSTDYTSYSLLYSCENVVTSWGNHRRVWSAKHSRTRTLTAAAETTINNYIGSSHLLHHHFYEPVDQSDAACFHYSTVARDQIILPGQCDPAIPVQFAFDPYRFTGTWYQMERYPYPLIDHDATCVGANITADGFGFRVSHWEVARGRHNTIEGTALVDSATATVAITFPGQGTGGATTTNLRILLTDYENFALAYTCENINPYERAIGAFKLSRHHFLIYTSQLAIDRYMSTREELHQPFFISVVRNDDCDQPSSSNSFLVISGYILVAIFFIVLIFFALSFVRRS